MTAIRGYIAMSLDGYIADRDGGIDFLKRYETVDYGFDAFLSEIGTCVFGRTTYEQSLSLAGAGWPFAAKRVIVVSRRPLADPPANVERWDQGVDDRLVGRLRASGEGDVWIVGGAMLQSALLDLGALDRLQLGLIPVLLGDGIPCFRKSSQRQWFELAGVVRFPLDGALLDYRKASPTAS